MENLNSAEKHQAYKNRRFAGKEIPISKGQLAE